MSKWKWKWKKIYFFIFLFFNFGNETIIRVDGRKERTSTMYHTLYQRGKDRTGVLSAIILCLCGVDDATILLRTTFNVEWYTWMYTPGSPLSLLFSLFFIITFLILLREFSPLLKKPCGHGCIKKSESCEKYHGGACNKKDL